MIDLQPDIKENDILALSPELLGILLKDHTLSTDTGQANIFWATDNYADRGEGYQYYDQITIEAITGKNGNIIVPRALKTREQQQQRSREMAGLYPLYLAYNIYRARLRNEMFSPESLEEHQAIWDKAVAENIFVICKTPMAKSITRRTLLGFRKGKTNMWAPEDLINKIKNQPELFIKKVGDLVGKNVKIKAIVGNPPYQEVNEGNGNGANPLYHLFIDLGRKLSPIGSMIHPARFLFKAGKTPKDWNDKNTFRPTF